MHQSCCLWLMRQQHLISWQRSPDWLSCSSHLTVQYLTNPNLSGPEMIEPGSRDGWHLDSLSSLWLSWEQWSIKTSLEFPSGGVWTEMTPSQEVISLPAINQAKPFSYYTLTGKVAECFSHQTFLFYTKFEKDDDFRLSIYLKECMSRTVSCARRLN